MSWISTPAAPLIGVVHLQPLAGAPRFAGSMEAVLEAARFDADALLQAGFRRLFVENFGDRPFFAERVPSETIAAMALALRELRALSPELELGVNVLRNDARAALGLCAACGAGFLRVNVLVGAAVCDQGLIEGRAAELLRERQRLAPEVRILADVHVKHAAPLSSTRIEDEAADALERGLAEAVIVSGRGTGAATSLLELEAVSDAVGRERVLIGSGVTEGALPELLRLAGGAIVGTALKRGGDVRAPVDVERARSLLQAARAARPRE